MTNNIQEQQLFDAACSGRLDNDSHQALQTLLRTSPGARQRYLDYTALHADLFAAVRTARVHVRLAQLIEESSPAGPKHLAPPAARAGLGRTGLGRTGLGSTGLGSTLGRRMLAFAGVVLATAAGLLVALGPDLGGPATEPAGADLVADQDFKEPSRVAPTEALERESQDTLLDDDARWLELVARVSRVEGVQWSDDGRSYAVEDLLSAGDAIRLTDGLVEIEFRQGAVVVLEGPAHLVANDANAALLLQGKLAAVAPPWATGFRIDTPGVDVIDHGTKFAVNVSGALDETQVNVVVTEGEVELVADEQAEGGRRLRAGEGIQSTKNDVQDGDDAEARQLTNHLPSRPGLKNAVVVADRWQDWKPGVANQPNREGNWRYYTNGSVSFGDTKGYEELVWNEADNCYLPGNMEEKPWLNHYVRVHREGGHPGKGRDQVKDKIDRYSITGFVVPEEGKYRIEAGWLERRWARRWDRDAELDVAIHVNDGPILMRKFCNRDCYVPFRQPLGKLAAGDTIYVGVGPNGADHNDRFRWGFFIVRETTPAGEASIESQRDIALSD
ncbi:FecR domain-containing protein [Botrimarina hoheduenensis]|uniref:FecR protein n=1 Tax=Botrimarina hoheduenensis TaxID=2528000 RepID=A0A5C5WAC0_9BACT|nr:FecR domain-containing protein [Botrimarina hoheduenensis]TWT47848.1 FecR protein [Botrimarina hoheduenensis]